MLSIVTNCDYYAYAYLVPNETQNCDKELNGPVITVLIFFVSVPFLFNVITKKLSQKRRVSLSHNE